MRLNLALRNWQNSVWEWEKDWLVTSYDYRPSSKQAKYIQVLRHHFGSGPPIIDILFTMVIICCKYYSSSVEVKEFPYLR